eukprot:s873_g8.t1
MSSPRLVMCYKVRILDHWIANCFRSGRCLKSFSCIVPYGSTLLRDSCASRTNSADSSSLDDLLCQHNWVERVRPRCRPRRLAATASRERFFVQCKVGRFFGALFNGSAVTAASDMRLTGETREVWRSSERGHIVAHLCLSMAKCHPRTFVEL